MALIEEIEQQGNWLFRHRSFVPLVLFVVFGIAIFFSAGSFFPFDALWWQLSCFLVSLAGMLIRMAVIGIAPAGTSGKNREKQIAEQLNTSGIYSRVRHPLYLGNFLMWMGAALYTGIFWVIALSIAFFWLVYERIMFAEESFLRRKFGEEYLIWAATTPAFFPKLRKGKKSILGFSIKNIVKRETEALINTIFSFVFINALWNYFSKNMITLDPLWIGLLVGGGLIYLIVRVLRKTTRVLEVNNR